ncbi:MAG: thioredoxin [Candidatus Thermoplasmatota archaeon]
MASLDHPIPATDNDFAQIVKTHANVVVDAWAPWCGPCKRIEPIVNELAAEYGGKVVFVKLNTDENQQIAMRYGIMSIPTLMFFKNGERVDQVVGLVPKDNLKAKISKNFGV